MKRLILLFILLIPTSAFAKNNLNYLHTKGYKSDVHLAGTLYEGKAVTTLSSSHGYGFGKGLFVGGGVGIIYNPVYANGVKNRIEIPVFAEIKYSFLNKKFSPFVDLKAGGLYDYSAYGVGYIVKSSIGVDFWKFSLNAGIDWSSATYSTEGLKEGVPATIGTKHNYMEFFVGLSFNF